MCLRNRKEAGGVRKVAACGEPGGAEARPQEAVKALFGMWMSL